MLALKLSPHALWRPGRAGQLDSAAAADGPRASTAAVQKHRRLRFGRGARFPGRRDGAGATRRLGLLVFRCPVRGIVGRGHGVCLAVAGGWVGDRFDTGRDLLVSPGRNGARSRAVGLVLGICRHGGQYSRRFSSAIASACRSYFSFSASLVVSRFSVRWGSCSARRY
jgi:hypothetical protein